MIGPIRDNLINELSLRLSKKRFDHSVGVEGAAVELARRYGADEKKAALAGLLHDVTKELSTDEQMKIINKNGIILDETQRLSPKLLHAITAPIVIKEDFSIDDDEILSAVRYHTTGKRDMSLLEKIIYIADLIEPGRGFEGVQMLRAEAGSDLDGALALALKTSAKKVLKKGAIIHRDSIKALDFLEKEKGRNGKKSKIERTAF